MPQMGYDMQEGTIVRWLKQEGSEISVGEPIAEIETDKAVVEFESPEAGFIYTILAPEGTTIEIGKPIAIITAEGEKMTESVPEKGTPQPPDASPHPPSQPTPPPNPPIQTPGTSDAVTRSSPVARRLAQERGIDISLIQGTGPGNRIVKDDVLGFKPEPSSEEPSTDAVPLGPAQEDPHSLEEITATSEAQASVDIPVSKMRQQIARVTVSSKQEKPHLYISTEIDMTRTMEVRQHLNQSHGEQRVHVSVNDLIIKSAVEALKNHHKINAFYHDDGIQMNDRINIGIAMSDDEDNLTVPAITDCNDKSIWEIAAASRDLSLRVKNGTLSSQEYTEGTFAISNLGMFDVTSFIAIIQPPQSAILAIGNVAEKPVVRDGEVTVALMMTATLSADHRIIDGAEGARFLVEIKGLLENPLGLLL